jgi:hypothetical protein
MDAPTEQPEVHPPEPPEPPKAPEAPKLEPSEAPAEYPEAPAENPEPEYDAEVFYEVDPEPGSPRRRKRPRESAPPGLTVSRLDASFWQQLIHESRAIREASRRERYANLLRF